MIQHTKEKKLQNNSVATCITVACYNAVENPYFYNSKIDKQRLQRSFTFFNNFERFRPSLKTMTTLSSQKLNCDHRRCDSRFQRAFTVCCCVFKVITLVWANQGNFFENANAYSKRTLKATVATHLNKWTTPVDFLFRRSQTFLSSRQPL